MGFYPSPSLFNWGHDPQCRLLKQEPCVGILGADYGHYLDQLECRNCGARCECDRIAEIRQAIREEE